MRVTLAAVVTPLLAAGCATVGTLQAECNQVSASFREAVQCVDAKVKADTRLARNPSSTLYVLRGYQLSERLDRKEITELDARVELQQLVVQIKSENDAAVQRAVSSIPPPKPILRTTCSTIGGITTCRTQ